MRSGGVSLSGPQCWPWRVFLADPWVKGKAWSAGRSPYLRVVVTSCNDDHGGDPLKRLQTFVNCFDAQCRRTGEPWGDCLPVASGGVPLFAYGE